MILWLLSYAIKGQSFQVPNYIIKFCKKRKWILYKDTDSVLYIYIVLIGSIVLIQSYYFLLCSAVCKFPIQG